MSQENQTPKLSEVNTTETAEAIKAISRENFCELHKRPFEQIKDRSEHFEEEHADPFGCPQCYLNSEMES